MSLNKITATIPTSVVKANGDHVYRARLWQTTESDRHGDSIDVSEFQFENYQRNPVVLLHHNHTEPIGRASKVWTEGDSLFADFVLSSTTAAKEAATLIADGVLSAVSVGFQELEKGVLDLLEFSLVSVPANPAAVIIQRSAEMATETAPDTFDRILTAPAIVDSTPRVYNLAKAMALAAGERGVDAGYEREVGEELSKQYPNREGVAIPLSAIFTKAHDTDAGSPNTGDSLTSTATRGDLFSRVGDGIRHSLVTGRMGAQVVVEPAAEVANIPVMSGALQAGWRGKDTDTAETTAGFKSRQAVPHYLGAYFEIERSALMYSNNPAISDLLASDLRAAVATELDRVALSGDSGVDANEPDGVEGIVAKGTAITDVPTFLAAIQTIWRNNENAGGTGIITSLGTLHHYAQLAMVAGVNPAYVLGDPNLFGIPALATPTITPSIDIGKTFIGDWSQLLTVIFGDAGSVVLNPYADSVFTKGGILGRLLIDADCVVRDPAAFYWSDSPAVTPAAAAQATSKKAK
jgi:HK97 family phage prohead protease